MKPLPLMGTLYNLEHSQSLSSIPGLYLSSCRIRCNMKLGFIPNGEGGGGGGGGLQFRTLSVFYSWITFKFHLEEHICRNAMKALPLIGVRDTMQYRIL